jgi:DNA (cytosine-5)-methyltransferase 1
LSTVAEQLGNSNGSRGWRDHGAVCDEEAQSEGEGREFGRERDESVDPGADGGMDDAERFRGGSRRLDRSHGRPAIESDRHSDACDPWADCEWLPCSDGVSRPVESGTFPLAHGVPARVGRLRGYGNAIVPQVAAAFIEAAFDAIEESEG